jgi:hypothetical protein
MATKENTWFDKFEKVEAHIKTTNEVPTNHHPVFGNFMRKQRVLYNQELATGIIQDDTRHNLWKQFIEDNKSRSYANWLKQLDDIKTYTQQNNVDNLKTVSNWRNNKINKIIKEYGEWVEKYNDLYDITIKIMKDNNYTKLEEIEKNDVHLTQVGIMISQQVFDAWKNFKEGPIYHKHFMNTVDEWYESANKLKHYINKNGRYPLAPSTEKKNGADESVVKIATFVASQKRRKNEGSVENKFLYAEWQKFLAENKC